MCRGVGVDRHLDTPDDAEQIKRELWIALLFVEEWQEAAQSDDQAGRSGGVAAQARARPKGRR